MPKASLRMTEFILLFSLTTALTAMSIDTILPALRPMGRALAVADPNDVQLVVSMFVLGMVLGELVFGVLADAYGRKLTIQIGLGIFAIGCVVSVLAGSLEVVLVGRFIQGIGAAGPQIGSRALIRDRFEGAEMARVMSFIMMIFALTPMIAPALGQIIVAYGGWQSVFAVFLAAALVISLWMGLRQPETLPQERRRPFTAASIGKGLWEVVKTRVSFGYTIAAGLIFGAFNCYLISSQQIFADIFDIHETYALYFGGLAIPIAIAGFLNSVLVMRFGMRSLCRLALYISAGLSGMFLLAAFLNGGVLPLSAFLIWAVVSFFTMGLMFGNVNAIAMEPLGHLAGIGAAVIGSLSTLMSGIIGWYVGSKYDETLIPLIGGFSVLAALSLITIYIADKGRVPTQYTEDGQIIDTDNTQS